jgi:hypothetical protein
MEVATSNPSLVAQLFTAAGVKRVVFVDDRFGITPGRIQSLANDLTREQLATSQAFPDVDFASDDEDVARGVVERMIGQATPDQLEVMFDKMAAVEYDYGDAEKDRRATEYFYKVILPPAEIVALSLKEWEQRKTVLLSEAIATPTLFIFDDDFTLEGHSTTHGRQLVAETHTVNPDYRFVYALLTHKAQTDDAELGLQRTIAEESPELGEYLLVIAKSRLWESGERFAERMKHLLLYRLFRTLTRRLRDETAQASGLALKQIESLGVQSFERIILGTSRSEGAWSPDTLVRVIGVYQQQEIKHNIRRDVELHRLVREINPICDVATAAMSDAVTADARRLQHDENYEAAERINSVHLPVATGDIFTDVKGQQYVLLAQPCDLVVRSTGYRRTKERDSRQGVPLARIRKAESRYEGLSLPSEQYELPYFADKYRWSVWLNETYNLPLWLLDLSVLNPDGRCALKAGQEMSPLLVEPWRKRLVYLNERASAIAAIAARITDASIDKGDLLQSYCRIPLGSPFEVQLAQTDGAAEPDWILTFGLTRTNRIRESHATGILIDYSAYLARLAHPHDLTRVGK